MNIYHTADWHFNEKNHDEVKKCLDFMVDHMTNYQETIDLILISGDITDSRFINFDSRSCRTIFNLVNRMLSMAPVAIVTGTESHDGKVALALKECKGKYPVLVSDMPEQFVYVNENIWVEVSKIAFPEHVNAKFMLTQLPQPTKQYFVNEMSIEDSDKAISKAMDSILTSFMTFQDIPHIVNGHFQVGGAFISETQQMIGRDIELSTSQLAMLNADLICLGHIHKQQKLGNNIFYAGSPTRMNFGEKEDKGFYVHSVMEGSDALPTCNVHDFIKTPARMMLEIKIDFTRANNKSELEMLKQILHSTHNDSELNNSDLKITLTVWQDEAKAINQAELKESFIDAGCNNVKLILIRKPREAVRAERVLAADTLPDKLVAMAELRGEEVSASILDKAGRLESGENEPWKMLDN